MTRPCLFVLNLLSFLTFSLCIIQTASANDGVVVDFGMPKTSTIATAPPTSSPPPTSSSTPPPTPVLSFNPPFPPTSPPSQTPPPPPPPKSPAAPPNQPQLFAGGSDSLVARTVGHAEGTRGPDGSYNRAYYGHVDPGNGVWNLGSFSFQHCKESQYSCSTPEEADIHQLRRLQGQAQAIQQKAEAAGLDLTLLEELNGIDLANQAPLAALDTPGYIEWLKLAREKGLTGSEAVLWARTQSYWNPRRNRWEAPGLGNSEDSISHDQNRRLTAIARALDWYQQQVASTKVAALPEKVAEQPEEKRANDIIFQDLSTPKPETDQSTNVALSISQ